MKLNKTMLSIILKKRADVLTDQRNKELKKEFENIKKKNGRLFRDITGLRKKLDNFSNDPLLVKLQKQGDEIAKKISARRNEVETKGKPYKHLLEAKEQALYEIFTGKKKTLYGGIDPDELRPKVVEYYTRREYGIAQSFRSEDDILNERLEKTIEAIEELQLKVELSDREDLRTIVDTFVKEGK